MGGKTKPTKHTAKELARNVFRAASGRRWHEAPNPKNVCAGPCFDSKQLPWTHVIRRSLCVFGAWRIHHCRNATRSTVHDSGTTPSLTTCRHLPSSRRQRRPKHAS